MVSYSPQNASTSLITVNDIADYNYLFYVEHLLENPDLRDKFQYKEIEYQENEEK